MSEYSGFDELPAEDKEAVRLYEEFRRERSEFQRRPHYMKKRFPSYQEWLKQRASNAPPNP